MAVSLILGSIGYFRLKTNRQPSVKVIELLPDQCDLLLIADNYSEFSNALQNRNLLWQEIKYMKGLSKAASFMNYFDSLLVNETLLAETIGKEPVYCATYSDAFIIALNLKELSDEKEMKEILERLQRSLTSQKLFADVQMGVIGISDSKSKLEVLFDKKKTSIADNKDFSSLSNSVKYPGLSIYFNLNSEMPLQHSFFGVSLKPDKIVLNGVKNEDSTEFKANMNGNTFTSIDFIKNIPLLCNAFDLYAIDPSENYFDNSTGSWWQSVNDSALFDAKRQFYNALNGMAANVVMPSGKNAFVIGVNDTKLIKEILPFMCDTTGNTDGIFSLRENGLNFSTSTFPKQKIGELSFLQIFEERIVLCENANDALIFRNAAANSSSILNNERFRNYASKNFNTEFHLLSYRTVNVCSREQLPFREFISEKDREYLKNAGHYSMLACKSKSKINFRISINYLQENVSDEPNVLWTMNTDSTIRSKCYSFKNHITKEQEILVQAGDELHLLSATGKIIWKKKLNESIQSDIFTIDVFNNGKLQMLFNSRNYLHLIDRNGNYVPPYPVKLPSRATNKLCVFDYENKNDLRLMIACADRKIYNYTVRGEKNDGFKPLSLKANVELPIAYCKVGLSDYLITADVEGQLYAFSRKGEGRIDFRNKLTAPAASFTVLTGNTLANTKVVYYDEQEHVINRISLSDVKEISEIKSTEGKQVFSFYDTDRNTLPDLMIGSKEQISIFELNGSASPVMDLPMEMSPSDVRSYSIGPNTYVCFFSKENETSFVYHMEGGIFKKFASTEILQICDLFNDGKAYVLIANKNELKCVKL